MKILSQQPTISTSAYTAGDAVGGLLTFDFGNVSGTFVIKDAFLLEDEATPQAAGMELHLFSDPALVGTDQSAYTKTQAQREAGEYFGKLEFSSYAAARFRDNAGAQESVLTGQEMFVNIPDGKLYGQLVTTGTPTYATAADLVAGIHAVEY